jgi:peroxiredoxin
MRISMRNLSFLLLALAALAACSREEKTVDEPKPTLTYSGGAPAARGAAPAATATTASTATSTAAEAPAPDTSVGQKMPAFPAQTLDGKPFDLASQQGRDVVLLNVWATWCGPCRYEIPDLVKMHQQYAAQGFQVVGVSVDEGGADAVKDFVAEQKMTYPVALDGEGKVTNILQTTVLPTSVLIDRTGTIVWRHFGLVETGDAALKKALDTALAQPRA